MVDETLRQIETRIQNSAQVPPATKSELLDLLGQLREEMNALCRENPEGAQALAQQIDLSTRLTRASARPSATSQHRFHELSDTVTTFEKEHPKLVDLINRVSTLLANMGI